MSASDDSMSSSDESSASSSQPFHSWDVQEERFGRKLWINEAKDSREYRERYWRTPRLQPRQQPARVVKKKAGTPSKLVVRALHPGSRPESLQPPRRERLIQWILARGQICFLDKNEFFQKPLGNPHCHGWTNSKADWANLREHGQMTTTLLQLEKGRGGEGVAYLVQTGGPGEARPNEKVPRRKRYYIVKTLRDSVPVGVDAEGNPNSLEGWMLEHSNEYAMFSTFLRGWVHPNVCGLEAIAGVPGISTGLLFYEYCDGGDLHKLIIDYQRIRDSIPEAFIWHVGAQLADAVRWLHTGERNPAVAFPGGYAFTSQHRDKFGRNASAPLDTYGDWQPRPDSGKDWIPILHADMKPANVFLKWRSDDPNRCLYPDVKLGDFGFADTEQECRKNMVTYATPQCGPPDREVTCAMDVWAVGSIIYAMAAGGRRLYHTPFGEDGDEDDEEEDDDDEDEEEEDDDDDDNEEDDDYMEDEADADSEEQNENNGHSTRNIRHALRPQLAGYDIGPLPWYYTPSLDGVVRWILNLKQRERPNIRSVAAVFAIEGKHHIKSSYEPLASWYVLREEHHQRSLPGFQLGGGKGRNLSAPMPEKPIGNMD